MIKIRRGLNLPIAGAPEQVIHPGPAVSAVAAIGDDYVGLRPTMAVKEGDAVSLGQLLFVDRDNDRARITAPASGVVRAIHRGDRRVLQAVVIEVEGDAAETFGAWPAADLAGLRRDQILDNLVQSGLWAALRTRPYSRIPAAAGAPHSLFVTAIDTNPLGADPAVVIADAADDFANGLQVLRQLVDCPIQLCTAPEMRVPTLAGIDRHEFSGPHPAGLVGTHIHFLDPVSARKTVWHIGYQDVIAIGRLFVTGRLPVERVVALGGPAVRKPRLLRTRLGAHLPELVADSLIPGPVRLVSGSVLGGRTARGELAYLGRYHQQVTALEEGAERHFLRYLAPGTDAHSALPVFLSRFNPRKVFAMNCSTNGSERAMVPLGNYERVMPLDILPTQLLRALIVGDTEAAQQLGCLELDEEDLALCSYVCVGKYEYGPILRDNLTRIEKEG
ncbi:MAG: Na(+)-translocating NADH-quinone reductase subunit A [Pseudomonadales bacterium]|nr:Na(+)-translocating NADH-quinone reductase subunit A [Pseudomonadales bacterium]